MIKSVFYRKAVKIMKRLVSVFLLLSLLLITLSSCAELKIELGNTMSTVYSQTAFENDSYLIIDSMLINKNDKTITPLKIDENAPLPDGIFEWYYYVGNAYKYVFEESHIQEYIILTNHVHHQYCIITYDYNGNEIERSYKDFLSDKELQKAYRTKFDVDSFTYSIKKGFIFLDDRNDTEKNNELLTYVQNQYESTDESNQTTILGLARSIGNELWVSSTFTNYRVTLSRDLNVMDCIKNSKITAYNSETKEYRTVFEYGKKKKQIIDFDENGIYTLDKNSKLCYVDFETEKSTLIHDFKPDTEYLEYFVVTDKYILVKYRVMGNYVYLIYEKGGAVITTVHL